jgi:hypothetical protein
MMAKMRSTPGGEAAYRLQTPAWADPGTRNPIIEEEDPTTFPSPKSRSQSQRVLSQVNKGENEGISMFNDGKQVIELPDNNKEATEEAEVPKEEPPVEGEEPKDPVEAAERGKEGEESEEAVVEAPSREREVDGEEEALKVSTALPFPCHNVHPFCRVSPLQAFPRSQTIFLKANACT